MQDSSIAERCIEMTNPFKNLSDSVLELERAVAEIEVTARSRLPGVRWDFSELKRLLSEMAVLIEGELPLKAYRRYLQFSVRSPGSLLGALSSEAKRAAARAVAGLGGSRSSRKKKRAGQKNLAIARKVKRQRFYAGLKSPGGAGVEAYLALMKKRRFALQAYSRLPEYLSKRREETRKEVVDLEREIGRLFGSGMLPSRLKDHSKVRG